MRHWLDRWQRRVRATLRSDEVEREMDEEMRFHVEMETEERIRAGMPPEEARRSAMRDFGSVDRFKEQARDLRRMRRTEELVQDSRLTFRTLRKNPGFALVAVVTLALGIGANTAIFSVVNGVLLRPLPYPDPDRLVRLWERSEQGAEMGLAEPNFRDWREMSQSFEALAFHSDPRFAGPETVLGADVPVRVRRHVVSREFFQVFQARPRLGRTFIDEEATQGGPPAVVVSHGFWRTRMGADPQVLRRSLELYGTRFRVVGVMPPDFAYPAGTDLWTPVELDGPSASRTAHNWVGVARLRPGVTPEAAQRELDRLTTHLRAAYGSGMDAAGARVVGLQEELYGDLRRPLLLLLAASALVLVVACANLASTLLARGTSRHREVAIRTALGATRIRVVRQLLTESLLLSLLGTLAGIGVAALIVKAVLTLGPATLGGGGRVRLDGWVLGFALVVALVTALLFGLVPALQASESKLADTLRAGGRGSSGERRRGVWAVLVGSEVALALLLLVGSGLLIQSFRRVLGVDAGFQPRGVLTAELSLPASKYAGDPEIAGFYRRALAEARGVPGVTEAGVIQHLPLSGMELNGGFEVEGRPGAGAAGSYRVASGGYFRAMGIPLLRGRLLDERDRAGTPDVAVVSQALARRVWPNEDPIGKRVRNLANDSWIYPDRWITIVGVVGDVRAGGLLSAPREEVYVSYLQRPARARESVLTLRTAVPPASVAAAVGARLRALDADVPVETATMDERVMRSVAERRFTTLLLAGFALVALALAGVGIYGVVSYSVARRTREIGIRIALGAHPGAMRTMMQRNAMAVVLAGVAGGFLASFALVRLLRGMLYDVSPTDPATFAAVALLITGVAWLASYIPAHRATRVDPIVTMRAE
jgi:putative ABC transport system permease protein